MMNEPSDTQSIYKIFLPIGWERMQRDGGTVGTALDQTDGYIHFSTAGQLKETLDKHYADADRVVVVEVDATQLEGPNLRWEIAREDELFPHLYARLPLSATRRHWLLHPDADGRYALPDLSEGRSHEPDL